MLIKPEKPKYLKEYEEQCAVIEDYRTGLPKGFALSWGDKRWLEYNQFLLILLTKL